MPIMLRNLDILPPGLSQTMTFSAHDVAGSLGSMPGLLLAEVEVGGFLAWWKILILGVIFLVWLGLLPWIDRDTAEHRFPREMINSLEWVGVVLAMGLIFIVPEFVGVLISTVVLFAAGIGGYLIYRKTQVGLEDVPGMLGLYFKNLFRSKKVKLKDTSLPEVAFGNLTLMTGKGRELPIPEQEDPRRAGYEAAHRVLLDPLYKGSERVAFVPAGDRYATKMTIDGFDYAGEAFPTEVAQVAIEYFKDFAGMDNGEHRKKQKGQMRARIASGSHKIDVTTSGTRNGESVIFDVDPAERYKERASQLGFTSTQREQLADVIADKTGLVIAAAPPGGGLQGLGYGLMLEHDAFTQFIMTAERPIVRDIEGITQDELPEQIDAAKEQEKLSWVADQVPDVFYLSQVSTKQGAAELVRLSGGEEPRRVYLGMRAFDCGDAMERWAALAGDPKRATMALKMLVSGRVMRKLCDACKIAYDAPEAVLSKMGVPKGKVKTLYKARTEPMLDQRGNPIECNFCGGLGYSGRIGAYEMLLVDDKVRQALRKEPTAATVKALMKQQKQPSLNDAALRQVIAGRTDLQEVQRAMNAGRKTASSQPPAPAPATA